MVTAVIFVVRRFRQERLLKKVEQLTRYSRLAVESRSSLVAHPSSKIIQYWHKAAAANEDDDNDDDNEDDDVNAADKNYETEL